MRMFHSIFDFSAYILNYQFQVFPILIYTFPSIIIIVFPSPVMFFHPNRYVLHSHTADSTLNYVSKLGLFGVFVVVVVVFWRGGT